jgi:hypothetical protein
METIDYTSLQEYEHNTPFPSTQHLWEQPNHLPKDKLYEAHAAGSAANAYSLTPTQIVDEISKPIHFRKAQ